MTLFLIIIEDINSIENNPYINTWKKGTSLDLGLEYLVKYSTHNDLIIHVRKKKRKKNSGWTNMALRADLLIPAYSGR